VITMGKKETTSTNTETGDEVNKGSDLVEICKKDGRTALCHHGAEDLKPQELLEVLISVGCKRGTAAEVTKNLWEAFDGHLLDVFTASIHQLTQIEGIGFVKACQVKAAFELMKRIESYCKEEHPQITSADDAVHLLAPHMRHLKQEEFRVILLDSRKRLIRHCQVSLGSLDQTIVHPREVFRPAVAAGAKYIFLVHNHPSGDPKPSEYDTLITQKLCMSGKILDIKVLDHIIIGFPDHVSLRDEGLM